MTKQVYNVPIGPAEVEFGATTPTVFDITKGGIVFTVNTTKQDITVDQFGDTPVKSILKGRTCQVKVPYALSDLEKLSKVTPNSTFVKGAGKVKLEVYSQAGADLTETADKLVIKPTAPNTTPNDYVTIPLAAPMTDIEYTYNSDNERIAMVTFVGYPDEDGLLYILGDTTTVAV
jgi:hypothetical protein